MHLRYKPSVSFILLLLCCLTALSGCSAVQTAESGNSAAEVQERRNRRLQAGFLEPAAPAQAEAAETLTVQFLDVGQADCILLTTPSHEAMLIDAGNNADGAGIVQYLRDQGVTELAYAIGTHPHEDHIGGLDDVIQAFPIGELMMPKVMTQTVTFESVLDAAAEKDLQITAPAVGDVFTFGEGSFQILSVGEDDENLNSCSIVIRVTYGEIHFVLTGDAEKDAEERMLSSGLPLSADILKIGHHGSETSSGAEFLEAVAPKECVISVGRDNSYGHPAESVLARIAGEHTYRTDQLGTIVVTTDGLHYQIDTKTTDIDGSGAGSEGGAQADSRSVEVYVTQNGAKYHRDTCSSVANSKIPMSLEDAREQGYQPCGRCRPQQ